MLVTDTTGEADDKLLVTADDTFGVTLGEHVDMARERLDKRSDAVFVDGIFYEPIRGSHFDIAVFGAGHVGSALVNVLATLDCNVRWIDSRRNVFGRVPHNALAVESRDPALEVAAIPPGAFVLVMTHSHALDFDICARALARRDLAYVGLIGSQSKRRRFIKRFEEHGLSQKDIARLTCPIGVDGVPGKRPAEIAVSVSAQLLERRGHEKPLAVVLPDNVTRLKN